MAFLASILLVPVLINGVRHFCQPRPIFDQFQNIDSGEKLDAVGWRIAERLEKSARDEHGHIMGLTVQHPGSLFDGEPSRRLSNQC